MADNPTRKFKFISPGVFIDEIDNSQLPAEPGQEGPLVIGRARKGPAMVPVTVESFSEFVDVFGEPLPGNEGEDVAREGNTLGATYAPYAAQAWLKNSTPLTFMRTVGVQDPDATSAGYAGWKAGTINSTVSAGGAWGLFLWLSGSIGPGITTGQNAMTGALAAVFYCPAGRIMVSGTTPDGALTSSACMIFKTETDGDINLTISSDGLAASNKVVRVSMNPNKSNFIRKVLNTNPTLTNTNITRDATATSNQGGRFWVGETYERSLLARSSDSIGVMVPSGTLNYQGSRSGSDDPAATGGGGNVTETTSFAAIFPLRNQESITEVGNDFQFAATKASTGWFFCQDTSVASQSYDATLQQKLFRIEALTAGESVQRDIKVSISDIKQPQGAYNKYGTFSVLVRKMSDNDNKQIILERWDQLDLNPASPNYLPRKIGDKFVTYDSTDKRNREYGTYGNRSKYIRVVMDEDVDAGVTDPELLPFGVLGPLTYRSVTVASGSSGLLSVSASARALGIATALSGVRGGVASLIDGGDATRFGSPGGYPVSAVVVGGGGGSDNLADGPGMVGGLSGLGRFTGSIVFPSVPLRKKGTWGTPKSLKHTYWGAWTGRTATDVVFNDQILDCLKPRLKGLQTTAYSPSHDLADSPNQKGAVNDPLVIAWHFTIDDISGSTAAGFQFISGSRQGDVLANDAGRLMSVTAASSSYSGALDAGLDRFTTVLHGGSDGFDVQEKDPFRQSNFNTATNEKTSYPLHTLKRAINIVSDSEDAQYNLISIPGVVQTNVIDHLLDTVEERADALAIVDIDKIYDAETENTKSVAARNAYTIKQATDALSDRNINNSYGAAYAPWVLVQDDLTSRNIWMPPSVAVLGVLSSTDKTQGPWFAPAGFTRGGLSEGAAGLPVLDVSKRLTQDDRDRLYENNINPIAKFPAEGIVVFGQKTLQQTRSALDRINVRRLMIFVKRRISFIASRLLFDPNNQVTWNRFKGQAEVVLDDVKGRFGIEEFRIILDESTTTPDLIDQNVIYAKLLIKPTRAVEFFAIDFVVTNSGASFED